MDKKKIREEMLAMRKALSKKERNHLSGKIAEHIIHSPLYDKNHHICIYQPFRGEVICDKIKTQAFLDKKMIYVPVTNVEQKSVTFYRIDESTTFTAGAYGIMEPAEKLEENILKNPALILMPGLAFDEKKHRVGYGGGYYDRYLENHHEHITVALCFGFQVLNYDLPYEEHDILPDYIVTENGLF